MLSQRSVKNNLVSLQDVPAVPKVDCIAGIVKLWFAGYWLPNEIKTQLSNKEEIKPRHM